MITKAKRGRDGSRLTVIPSHASARLFAALMGLGAFGAILPGAGCSGEPTGEAVRTSTQALLGDGLVISQVYGAGGNNNATLNQDFVELFNRSDAPVSLAGLSIQYGSATGKFATASADGGIQTTLTVLPAVDVAPGSYFLVGMSAGANGTALPTVDFTGPTDLGSANGKVALARITTSLGCGSAANLCALTDIVDLVGYGTSIEFEGTAPVGALSATKAAIRNGSGCTNTPSNVSDFTVGTPAPRNSSTAPHSCDVADAGSDTGIIVVIGSDASNPTGDDGGAAEDTGTTEDAGTPQDDSGPAASDDAGAGFDAGPSSDDAGTSVDASAPVDGSTGPADAGSGDASPADAGADASNSSTGVSARPGLVISQVYGGGGNNGAPYSSDFVELFNRSVAPISLAGLSLQYGSKAGNFDQPLADGGLSGNIVVLPATNVAPGSYFLVGLNTGTTGSAIPTADATGTMNLSATDGKVVLAEVTSAFGCGAAGNLCAPTQIVDLVGYGGATDFEGHGAAPVLSNTKADFRDGNGCKDTRDNSADFAAAAPAPRNSATAPNLCFVVGDDGGLTATDAGSGVDAAGAPDGGQPGLDDSGAPSSTDAAAPSSEDSGAPSVDDSGLPIATDDASIPLSDDGGALLGGGAGSSGCSCSTAGETRGASNLAGLSGLAIVAGALSSRRRRRAR